MFEWLKEMVFRTIVLREILELSGQRRPSLWRQIYYGFDIAVLYIVISGFLFVFGLAGFLKTKNEIYLYLCGAGISFTALLYGLLVSPSRGGIPTVRNSVRRNQKNKVSAHTIVSRFPSTLDSIERQIVMLNVIYWISSICMFLIGLGLGTAGLLFQ